MRLLTLLFVLVFGFSQAQTFPEDYLGVYKGKLKITNPVGEQEINMEFHLTKTDTIDVYNYILVYEVNGEPSPRNYTLKVKNKDKGEFIVDENNGILLDAKFVDNTLYSMFEVQGNMLVTTERFYEDSMDFEIIFSSTQKKSSNSATDDVPEVTSYPVMVIQKAKLIKQ